MLVERRATSAQAASPEVNMPRRFLSLVLLGFVFVGASVTLRAEDLIIAGAGFVGAWDTEIDMANLLAAPVEVGLSIVGLPLGLPCPPNCTSKSYTLPGNGTLRVLASDFLGAAYPGPQMIRLQTAAGTPAPVVHARSVSSLSAAQFAELPVVRESSLEAMDTSVLVFPGAARQAGVYSNLILEQIGGNFLGSQVLVEIFDASGQSRGSRTFAVAGEQTPQATTIVDVALRLGITELEDGQVRVTRLSGTGSLWGVLTTVLGTGSLKVQLGANP
jgi:hypothetical protein